MNKPLDLQKNSLDGELNTLVADVSKILADARNSAYSAVNFIIVRAYWLIGRRIVEEEHHGKKRAEYGKYVIKTLSEKLTAEFGKGFSIQSIKNFRQFYLTFPELPIGSTTQSQLPEKSSTPWSLLS